MSFGIRNGLWLILPALLWNGLLTGRLGPVGVVAEAAIPQLLLWAEMVLRVIAFAAPVFLTSRFGGRAGHLGLALLVVGYCGHFGSWLPHLFWPDGGLALTQIGLLGPFATPLILFLGIALLGRSVPYAIAATLFVGTHVAHALLGIASLTAS